MVLKEGSLLYIANKARPDGRPTIWKITKVFPLLGIMTQSNSPYTRLDGQVKNLMELNRLEMYYNIHIKNFHDTKLGKVLYGN